MDAQFKLDDKCVDMLSYGEAQHFYVRRRKKRLAEQYICSQLQVQANATSVAIDQALMNECVLNTESLDIQVLSSEKGNLNSSSNVAIDQLPINECVLNKESLDVQVWSSENGNLNSSSNTPSLHLSESDHLMESPETGDIDSSEASETPDQTHANNAGFEKYLVDNQVLSPENKWVSDKQMLDIQVLSSEKGNLNLSSYTPSLHSRGNPQISDKDPSEGSETPDQTHASNADFEKELVDARVHSPENKWVSDKESLDIQVRSSETGNLNTFSHTPGLCSLESDLLMGTPQTADQGSTEAMETPNQTHANHRNWEMELVANRVPSPETKWVSHKGLLDIQVRCSGKENLKSFEKTPSLHVSGSDFFMGSLPTSDKGSSEENDTPDQAHASNVDFEKELADTGVPRSENRHSIIHNDAPTVALPESVSALHNAQTTKSTSKERHALRWSRELMRLIADGQPVNQDNAEVENKDLSDKTMLPDRKRLRLQTSLNTSLESANAIARKHYELQKPLALSKESQKKWRDVQLGSVDPILLIGCKCKVYWPDDKIWYMGTISEYNAEAGTHHVVYDDGDKEYLILSKERVRLYLSEDEMRLSGIPSLSGIEDRKPREFQEMAALASVFEDFQEEIRHGELVWAKIKGHPMWPAFVVDDKQSDLCGLDAPARETTLAVQFFGTYDFARISSKHVISFSKGLNLKLYGKCKKAIFDQGIKEAERYLKEGKLPETMSNLQNDAPELILNASQMNANEEDQDFMGDERTHKTKKSIQSLYNCPIDLGDLKVLSLGKIVRDSEFFHTESQIWTEGYSAVRKFTSIKDPDRCVDYRMEIVKDPNDRAKPLFRVTSVDGELAEGSTPSLCWKRIYQKLEKAKERLKELGVHFDRKRPQTVPGDSMFGFSNPQILKLIQALPCARACFKFTGWIDKKLSEKAEQLIPAGYKPVEVDWKHADRCSVCDLDEEYTNNLFLQCDRCRILVHMHCYGESELPNGHLWLCQLCRSGLSAQTSLCCLCPVQGGAMKKTTDERWAHLTCAMWIPETCFVDVKSMEPIDGLQSINKERWKLTCSICKVPYGVCIQCSEPSCYSAYHVLCARASGFVLEVVEDSPAKTRNGVEDLDEPVRFLSYCKRHGQLKMEKGTLAQQTDASNCESGYCPPENSSGCARTEAYNGATRRGRQEPEVRAAAAAKRHYVEKMPYFVGGFRREDHRFSHFSLQANTLQTKKPSLSNTKEKPSMPKVMDVEPGSVGASDFSNVWSVIERFQQMRLSLKHRLTFGKSAIHGWGVFTKTSHRAGDMVIEYAGEVVRPIVADLRERSIYNTLVGAGTYMFRIDDDRVVDATREGSIAHLINHSCEPNCFSRVVTVNGEEHIIIFAKRDIEEGEELSYDYRFNSKGEQLECFCGFPSCRGFVNVNEADEESNKILVPRSELTAWTPVPP